MIHYELYRAFYYVGKYRSFTHAAAALLTSQPNVTRAIKGLEAALGCTLFLRSNRGVSLTPEGEALFNHVSAAVEQLQAGEDLILRSRSRICCNKRGFCFLNLLLQFFGFFLVFVLRI